jgi:hypothetical protein
MTFAKGLALALVPRKSRRQKRKLGLAKGALGKILNLDRKS